LLLDAQAPSDADFAAKRDQIRDSLLQGKQQQLVWSVRFQLARSDGEVGQIKINQDEMKALTKTGSEEGM